MCLHDLEAGRVDEAVFGLAGGLAARTSGVAGPGVAVAVLVTRVPSVGPQMVVGGADGEGHRAARGDDQGDPVRGSPLWQLAATSPWCPPRSWS